MMKAETEELSQREICRVALQRLPVGSHCDPPDTFGNAACSFDLVAIHRQRRTRQTDNVLSPGSGRRWAPFFLKESLQM